MVFCKKCGAINDNDAAFCKKCGIKLGETISPQYRSDIDMDDVNAKPKKETARKFSKKIIIGSIGFVVIVALMITAFSMLGKIGNKNYENVVKRYIEAGYSHDGKKYLALFPNTLIDKVYKNSGVSKEDVYTYYSNKLSYLLPFSEVQDGDKWKFSFEITDCYDYPDYDFEFIETAYQEADVGLKLDAVKKITYSLQLTINGKEQRESTYNLNLMQIGGRWFVNDYYQSNYFIDVIDGFVKLRDFSVIYQQKKEKEDATFIADYLGCSTDDLVSMWEDMQDGKQHLMFRYVYPNGNGSYFRLYLSGEGKNARVMAYYPWHVTPNNQAFSIPVEELPEGERDNNWKIKFTDAAKPQEPTTTPRETDTIEPDNGIISAFPDGDESKTPVIYYDDSDFFVEREPDTVANQQRALMQYLGCSTDELWPAEAIGKQGDTVLVGFWYVDNYEDLSNDLVILLEDGTAAWCDTDISMGDTVTGTITVSTIAENAFQGMWSIPDTIDPSELSEAEQKALIAEYLGCSESELVYYKTNQAQRMEFIWGGGTADYLVFLLDDGTVAGHFEAEPPLREEGASTVDSASSDFVIENDVLTEYNGSGGDVVIPNGVTSIGESAFLGCRDLASVTIPNSVKSIEDGAFVRCGLTSVTIPSSVTEIGFFAFADCEALTSIIVSQTNKMFNSDNGVLFNKDKSKLHTYPSGKSESSFTIPNSVIEIGAYAFSDCRNLTSVTIPDSVTSMGEGAFHGCTNLTSINIPNSITSIESWTFQFCRNLTSVTIPNSVSSLGDNVFLWCENLTTISIPSSVTSIGVGAFADCTDLLTIHGAAGSYVETYAMQNEIPFVAD